MLRGMIARGRSLWRGVRRRADVEAEMMEEFRLHQELRAADLARQGLTPAEAAREARLDFGSVEMHKDAARAARGLRWYDGMRVSWLDVKLGFRMLRKYPGLTLVGGLATAFAIWIGAATFELVSQVIRPSLPLPQGSRIVGIRLWDAATSRAEGQLLHDLAEWRTGLRAVQDVGAFRMLRRNLITGPGRGEPVVVAELSASGFRVARTPALLGRTLVADDERPDAPAVAVIGHDVWQTRFAGDSAVVGRVVRLGAAPTTIVGVMPRGFAFPVAHNLWTPLRLEPLAYGRRQGPELQVFARLADGHGLADARAELETFGKRAAARHPDTHEHLRPQVLPYAKSIVDVSGWMLLATASANVPVILFLLLVCANVALLTFARAATREGELTVRTALGAGRGRIVTQLFAEALVLGGLAALVGLAAAGGGLRWVIGVIEAEFLQGNRLPFWFRDRLSPATVLYAVGLTVLGAVIAGVVPALKVTRALGARLKQASAGGGGLQFGGVWTAVIVAQIAVTMVAPVLTIATRQETRQIREMDVGFPTREYLSLRLEMDREPPGGMRGDTSRAAFVTRFRRAYGELERRLAADAAVTGVAFADRLPRTYHPHRLIDIDDGGAAPLDPRWPAYRVSSVSVGPGFFDALTAPVLTGRTFTVAEHAAERGSPGDSTAVGGPVIVNQSFVNRVLGGRNPIGRRIRYRLLEEWSGPRRLRDSDTWYEIVGVVRDMGMSPSAHDPKVAGIYHPVPAGGVYPAQVAVHVRGDPATFAPRLRALATEVDPTLRVYDLQSLDRVNDAELEFLAFWTRILYGTTALVLTLSLAGIYSVMAFTVARRTREIGVRVALGASRRGVLLAVFRRPLVQVVLGVGSGVLLLVSLFLLGDEGLPSPKQVAYILAYSIVMLAVCLLACVVPTRRALRVEPTVALREDG